MKGKYEVKQIEKSIAQGIIGANHYLHRKASCSIAFGLWEEEAENWKTLVGVCMFGKPASREATMLCGKENSHRVLELTRLWTTDDGVPNKESFFVAQCLKQLPPEYDIIISYADNSVGHQGYIYQATNWTYFGLTDKHVQWIIEGSDSKHSRHIFDQYGGVNKAKEALGDKMVRGERPRKHRYIYFRGSKTNKKLLKKCFKFKDKITGYPKEDREAWVSHYYDKDRYQYA